MPAYVDTGLNLAHVDDVARGHLLAHDRGRPGERYVLGGEDMTLKRILDVVGDITGRAASNVRLPHWSIWPVAVVAETLARFTGREPRATLDGLRMSRKHMYFSSAKAQRELGYEWRDPHIAIREAIDWFKDEG
jgi:dihydroflavonol-4-reductase